ncbi:MAG: CPBP family glutamic-type intramembrane protease [Pseudomonadota bacterium]
MPSLPTPTPISRGRLQRPPDFTGARLETFTSVFLRHGLPGALLGGLCLLGPGMSELLLEGLAPLAAQPLRAVAIVGGIFALLTAYACYLARRFEAQNAGWIAYLGILSLWEEWVFRVALPEYLQGLALLPWAALLLSNALFGAVHYFTLRWRWQWCVGAFLGGVALSRHYDNNASLLAITAFHWLGTSFNTPRPPSRSDARGA